MGHCPAVTMEYNFLTNLLMDVLAIQSDLEGGVLVVIPSLLQI